jgi:hypothetical protein
MVPSSTLLVEDDLTGRVFSTELSQISVDADFNGDSGQALRPSDPTTLLAYAEATQHDMRTSTPTTTEAKHLPALRDIQEAPHDFAVLKNPPACDA